MDARNAFPRPNYDRAIFSLLPTVFSRNFKIDIEEPYSNFEFRDRSILRFFEESELTILVIYDALGVDQLDGKMLELWKDCGGIVLSSVFPTLTAPAILSVYAGLPPELHGVISQRQYFGEIGNFVDTLRGRADSASCTLSEAGVDMEKLLWNKPILSVASEDIIISELIPLRIARNGGLRDFYAKYTHAVSYTFDIDMLYKLEYLLKRIAEKGDRALILVYLSYPDDLGHEHGIEFMGWSELLDRIYFATTKIMKIVDENRKTRISVYFISDHGLMPIRHTVNISQEKIQELKERFEIQKFAKSGRFAFIYTSRDINPEEIEQLFGHQVMVVETSDVLEHFWPLSNEFEGGMLSRAGKYIVLYKDFVESMVVKEEEDKECNPISELNKYLAIFKASHGGASMPEYSSIFIHYRNF